MTANNNMNFAAQQIKASGGPFSQFAWLLRSHNFVILCILWYDATIWARCRNGLSLQLSTTHVNGLVLVRSLFFFFFAFLREIKPITVMIRCNILYHFWIRSFMIYFIGNVSVRVPHMRTFIWVVMKHCRLPFCWKHFVFFFLLFRDSIIFYSERKKNMIATTKGPIKSKTKTYAHNKYNANWNLRRTMLHRTRVRERSNLWHKMLSGVWLAFVSTPVHFDSKFHSISLDTLFQHFTHYSTRFGGITMVITMNFVVGRTHRFPFLVIS